MNLGSPSNGIKTHNTNIFPLSDKTHEITIKVINSLGQLSFVVYVVVDTFPTRGNLTGVVLRTTYNTTFLELKSLVYANIIDTTELNLYKTTFFLKSV